MKEIVLGIKIDVDTEKGTRIGVPNLVELFDTLGIQATFLFSLGPDNTGRAIKRIFRPGFFQKASRTSVLQIYGLQTLLNGILWPGPHIGDRHGNIMRLVHEKNHEVGIHTYDHIKWQDCLHSMTEPQIRYEITKCRETFKKIFGFAPQTMGAAGWQANRLSLKAYDDTGFVYASDTRGKCPFYPKVKHTAFKTLQIPTTLPTLDELLGRAEYPFDTLIDHYLNLLNPDQINILTIHAELEGMLYLNWFKDLLIRFQEKGVVFKTLRTIVNEIDKEKVPVCALMQGTVDGRSGTLAIQGD
ncbi:MAG: putative 4-deoxy-4-formamido-L-arabinose-phosphoundecaprenol deformylase ArnD [Holosporales bacterium]